MVAVAKLALGQVGNVGSGPTRHAVPFGGRAAQDHGPQRGLSPLGQPGRKNTRPVAQAIHALGVVADHRITQGLPLHASQTCGIGAAHAFQRVCNGEGPRCARGLRARLAHKRNAVGVRSRLIFSAISALPFTRRGRTESQQPHVRKAESERALGGIIPRLGIYVVNACAL